jgi:cytochrome c peroxidase
MHDGSLASLEQVIEHYSTGIQPHKNLSENLSPLGFDAQEKKHLLAFLRSLDDYSFVTDERFKKRSRYEN